MCLKTFKKRNYLKRDEQFMWALQTRAWICHSLYTCQKVYAWANGTSLWLNNDCIDETEDCDYNRQLINKITPTLRVLSGILICINLILDILCYKYRSVTQSFLYLEITQLIIFLLIPSKYYLDTHIMIQMTFFIYLFVLMYCDSGKQIIFTIIAMFFQFFVTNLVGYGIPSSGEFLIKNGFTIILFSVVIIMIGMMVMYVFE